MRDVIAVRDPGFNRHEWEALDDDLRTDPAHTLPELDRLVVSPGDVAAISGYRAVFDHLTSTRSTADVGLEAADAEES